MRSGELSCMCMNASIIVTSSTRLIYLLYSLNMYAEYKHRYIVHPVHLIGNISPKLSIRETFVFRMMGTSDSYSSTPELTAITLMSFSMHYDNINYEVLEVFNACVLRVDFFEQ